MTPPNNQDESGRTKRIRGDLLKAARIMKGLGLEAFQASMGTPEVALATIKKAEGGGPSYLATIRRLCDALELQPETVIMRDDAPTYKASHLENWTSLHIHIQVNVRKDDGKSVQMLTAILGMLNQILPEKDAMRISDVEDDEVARRADADEAARRARVIAGLWGTTHTDLQMNQGTEINQKHVFSFIASCEEVHDPNDYKVYNIHMKLFYSTSSHKALLDSKDRPITLDGVTLKSNWTSE
jgi:hypothetical protein